MNLTYTLIEAPFDAETKALLEELPLAYAELDSNGVIVFANRAARAMQARENGDLVGQLAWQQMPPKDQEQSRAGFFHLMQTGEDPPVVRRSFYTTGGVFRTHDIHRSLIRDREGKPTGMRAVTMDVTEAHRAQEKAREAHLWLESVLDSLTEGVIVTDALGFVRTVNPAAENLLGFNAAELTGKPIEKALPFLCFADANTAPLDFGMTLRKPTKAIAAMLNREREEITVEISTSPILDKEHGCTLGVVSIWRRYESME
jgi:PAS domain S-box-containing protein